MITFFSDLRNVDVLKVDSCQKSRRILDVFCLQNPILDILSRSRNSAIRSAGPGNPTLEPNMKLSDHPLRRYGHSRALGAYGTPILGGRGGRRGSAMAPFETAMVVSYRLSIVTVVLSLTIQLQFAIECL